MINQDRSLRKELKVFVTEFGDEIYSIVGYTKLVIAERKHANTSSLLFKKASFSKLKTIKKESQKCGSGKCLTCPTMNLPENMRINDYQVKLDLACDCTTDSIIYIAVCNNCLDKPGLNHYIGQSVNCVRTRNNGHRDKFKISEYDKSALSHHTFIEHRDKLTSKLHNFSFGIIKHCSPQHLNREEDFYIYATKAETKGLNRYKVVK